MSNKPYTQQEDDFIRQNYLNMSYAEIGNHIDRSGKGVSNRAQVLGLVKLARWTDAEDKVIWESAGIPIDVVAKRLNRAVSEVSRRWRIIGDGKTWRGRGGYKPDRNGRAIIGFHRPNGYSRPIMEHRHVVEEHLERTLLSDEIVHHINTIKTDNRLENLFVCRDRSHHRQVHYSFEKLLPALLEMNIVQFNLELGVYELNENLNRL